MEQPVRRGLEGDQTGDDLLSSHTQKQPFRFKRKLEGDQTLEDLLSSHTQCQYFMEQKRRFCNVARTPDSLYCGNHAAFCSDSLKPARKRIPCPVDPSHSIYADCEQKHVKICNIATERRAMESHPYYCLNCNSGAQPSDADTDSSVVDPDALLSKINSFYSSLGALVAVEPRDVNAPVSDELRLIEETVVKAVAPAQSSFKQLRHAQQDAKIVYEMVKHKLLSPSPNCDRPSSIHTVYIELGAGRGVLGQAVSSVSSESSLVLVERSGQRRKADTQLRRAPGGQFTRIRMDIRHCRLSGLPPLSLEHKRGPKRVVVIAKHLCGVATDLALRSLETLPEGTASRGLSIATCCHHACMWDDYVGKDWLVASGFSRSEFNVLRFWSSWAFTLGSTRVSDASDPQEHAPEAQDQEKEHQTPALPQSVARPSGVTREAMAECGFKIKRLLDYGRLRYAREKLGLSACRVVQYCNPVESPECYLLVG